jgi:hypothetical protein
VAKRGVDALLLLLGEAFDHPSWHGTNLRGSIRGIDAKAAAWRPQGQRHNIWELVVHTAYWKYVVRRRLTGEKRGSFALQGSNFFARPQGDRSDRAFRADIRLLEREHELLLDLVRRLKDSDLPRKTRGSRWTKGGLIRGVAAHDLYHAGQIQLLKRLGNGKRR